MGKAGLGRCQQSEQLQPLVLGKDQFIGHGDTASGLCKHRDSGMPTTYPPPARAAGPAACVDISPCLETQIEIIYSQPCQPVLS